MPISPPSSKTWEIDRAAEAVAQGVASMEIQWPGILGGLTDLPKAANGVGCRHDEVNMLLVDTGSGSTMFCGDNTDPSLSPPYPCGA